MECYKRIEAEVRCWKGVVVVQVGHGGTVGVVVIEAGCPVHQLLVVLSDRQNPAKDIQIKNKIRPVSYKS